MSSRTPTSTVVSALAAVLLLCPAGCGDGAPVDGPAAADQGDAAADPGEGAQDAGAVPPADVPRSDDLALESDPPRVGLGTGELAFHPIEDGDTVELVRGFQGLQHIWIAFRTWNLDPERTITEVELTRDRDGLVVSPAFRVRLPFDVMPGGYAERTGMTLVVASDPSLVIGERMTIRASCEDGRGSVEARRGVTVVWGDGIPDR